MTSTPRRLTPTETSHQERFLSSDAPPYPVVLKPDLDLFGGLDLIVFTYGLFLILKDVIVGPVFRKKVARPLWLAEMGCNLFYTMQKSFSDFENDGADLNKKLNEVSLMEHRDLLERLASNGKQLGQSLLNSFKSGKTRVKIGTD